VANEYSRRWFSAFVDTIPVTWTQAEVEAICRRLPLPDFRRVLDVCCGPARHAAFLVQRGYQVTGIDRDESIVAAAREVAPAGNFLVLDMCSLSELRGPFDAALILWQSFGYFDSATNDQVLADLADVLRPGGRLLVDVYHPGWVMDNQGRNTDTRSPECDAITNTIVDDRLISTIEYVGGDTDVMNFELFEPSELVARAQPAGFKLMEACCWWDEKRPPEPSEQRYQLVLQRR